jgi:hypothetical protein
MTVLLRSKHSIAMPSSGIPMCYWHINKVFRNLRNFYLLVLCSLRARSLIGRYFAVRVEDVEDFAAEYWSHLEEGRADSVAAGAEGPMGVRPGPVYAGVGKVFGKGDSAPQTVFAKHVFYVFSSMRQIPLVVIWPPWIGVQGGGLCKVIVAQFAAIQ